MSMMLFYNGTRRTGEEIDEMLRDAGVETIFTADGLQTDGVFCTFCDAVEYANEKISGDPEIDTESITISERRLASLDEIEGGSEYWPLTGKDWCYENGNWIEY